MKVDIAGPYEVMTRSAKRVCLSCGRSCVRSVLTKSKTSAYHKSSGQQGSQRSVSTTSKTIHNFENYSSTEESGWQTKSLIRLELGIAAVMLIKISFFGAVLHSSTREMQEKFGVASRSSSIGVHRYVGKPVFLSICHGHTGFGPSPFYHADYSWS